MPGTDSRFTVSEDLLRRAEKVIPLGTQTFSKSKTQFPFGVSPYYITRGDGCRVWDVDGNVYLDFINALNAVTLGYNDADVNAAVAGMLGNGSIFSLPHPIEIDVAEKIVAMVPCAQMVRFGKNGSDATAGAVRAARAHTGRDYVAVCGYHGWQDWYIGSTARHKGVPQATRNLTLTFRFNDIDSLHDLFRRHHDGVAAVVMEAMHDEFPAPGFLEEVKELAHRNGALLVFDEMITGFRFANGGAQEYFDVIPDLATFGKGLSNGFPLSAVAGRADVMREFEEIFFSFTYGGETISLAAALATLEKLERQPVTRHMSEVGRQIMDGLDRRISEHGVDDFMSVRGHPTWSAIVFTSAAGYDEWRIKTLFFQEMFARGVLTYGAHNISYAHKEADVLALMDVYDEVLPIMHRAIHDKCLDGLLRCQPLVPLFRLRPSR